MFGFILICAKVHATFRKYGHFHMYTPAIRLCVDNKRDSFTITRKYDEQFLLTQYFQIIFLNIQLGSTAGYYWRRVLIIELRL